MTELFETWIRQNKVLSFYFKAKKLIRYRWSIRVRRKCRVRRPAIGTASNTSPTGGPSSKDTWSSQICRNDCASSSSFPLLSFPSLSMSLQTEQHQTNKSITMVPLFSLSILQSIYSNWSSPNSEINHFEMHLYYLRNKFVWIYVASGIHKKNLWKLIRCSSILPQYFAIDIFGIDRVRLLKYINRSAFPLSLTWSCLYMPQVST